MRVKPEQASKVKSRAPTRLRNGDGRKWLTGRRDSQRGTPQGGIISPLLANLYLSRLLKHWRLSGQGERWKARVIAYADDFVILSRAMRRRRASGRSGC